MNDISWTRNFATQDAAAPSPRWSFAHGQWECPLTCMQCIHMVNRNGEQRRCSRRTCYTLPYCWQHLKLVAHLRVGRTTLRGANGRRLKMLGLFACDVRGEFGGGPVFAANTTITSYLGELLTTAQMRTRYGNNVAPYSVQNYAVNRTFRRAVDAACFRGVGAAANDARPGDAANPNVVTNAAFQDGNVVDRVDANGNPVYGRANRRGVRYVLQDAFYPTMFATRNIYDGDEIFVQYGPAYWAPGAAHVPHATQPTRAYNKINYKC